MAHVLHRGLAFTQTVVNHPDGFEVILFRQGDTVHAYRNSCPHVGIGLDYGNGRCLADDGETLICAMHGATFTAATGECTGGPCYGKHLTRLAVAVVGEDVVTG
jgi:nitrite reductase/ring-hydroxylating ferredoxin subunit